MSNPPPSPTPSTGPGTGPPSPSSPRPTAPHADRVVATTGQLATALEDVGLSLDETTLESLLLAADRQGILEWVTLTRSGEYVWDLTDTPDRLASAIASALLEWLADRLGIAEALERDCTG